MKRNLLIIYTTAFFCGMTDMAVELSATRLLAPVFGTSMVVWTVVIGLIMISLSIGNIIGGRSADKHNSLDRLYALIWVAAIWIALIPMVGKYVIYLSVMVMMWILPGSLLVAGSVFSCLFIFSLPLVLLGMAPPYLVKLGAKGVENSGKTIGEIYALSTIGSIIGTFIPTFVTIPLLGTNKSFFVFSLLLNIICLCYFISRRARLSRTIISTVLVLALTLIPFSNSFAFWKSSVILEDESLYNYLQVAEEGDSVVLSTNVAFGVQSIYNKSSILSGCYYDYAAMSPLFIKNKNFDSKLDVLVLGLGTGTFAKQCRYFFSNSHIDGVEIDSKIVDLSKKYFAFGDSDADIFVNDGRTFLRSSDAGMYDLIMVDAYHDITIPFHMSTAEFFSEVKEHLNPGGIIMININMRSGKDNSLNDYLTQTVKAEMKKVYKFDIENGLNTIVIASDDENCLDNYRENSGKIPSGHLLYGISRYIPGHIEEVTKSEHIFTDDLAPVEILGQKVLNEVVEDEIKGFKEQLNSTEGGLNGIFDLLSGQ